MIRCSAKATLVATVVTVLFALRAVAAENPSRSVAPPASNAGTAGRVPVELFKGPRPKHIIVPNCEKLDGNYSLPGGAHLGLAGAAESACEALNSGIEGWVRLGFMVDPKGKPFEITVIDSTANETLEKAAIASIRQSTFVPGSLNGHPVESDYEMLYSFLGTVAGIAPEFIDHYKAAMRAIDAGRRKAADSALQQMKISNFSESAYHGLAAYAYAVKWGDETQQLADLKQAVVGRYLPPAEFRAALFACMELQLKVHDFAGALASWKRLQKSGLDAKTAARLRTVVDQLNKLRSDDTAYDVTGQMPHGSWYLHLFKRHFRVTVGQGRVSQVKLRCQKAYVYFAFDPKLDYTVGGKDGDCSIELVGAPGTRITLTQF